MLAISIQNIIDKIILTKAERTVKILLPQHCHRTTVLLSAKLKQSAATTQTRATYGIRAKLNLHIYLEQLSYNQQGSLRRVRVDVPPKPYHNYNSSRKSNGHKANIFFMAVTTMTSYLRGQFTDVNT